MANTREQMEEAKDFLESEIEGFRGFKVRLAWRIYVLFRALSRLASSGDEKTDRAKWKEIRDIVHLDNYQSKALVALARHELKEGDFDGEGNYRGVIPPVDPTALGRVYLALEKERITTEQCKDTIKAVLDDFMTAQQTDKRLALIAPGKTGMKPPSREQAAMALKHINDLGELNLEKFEALDSTTRQDEGGDFIVAGRYLTKGGEDKKEEEDENQTQLLEPDFEGEELGEDEEPKNETDLGDPLGEPAENDTAEAGLAPTAEEMADDPGDFEPAVDDIPDEI